MYFTVFNNISNLYYLENININDKLILELNYSNAYDIENKVYVGYLKQNIYVKIKEKFKNYIKTEVCFNSPYSIKQGMIGYSKSNIIFIKNNLIKKHLPLNNNHTNTDFIYNDYKTEKEKEKEKEEDELINKLVEKEKDIENAEKKYSSFEKYKIYFNKTNNSLNTTVIKSYDYLYNYYLSFTENKISNNDIIKEIKL